ncbi:MAG: Dextranase [Gammaproteobacteria bacterium]|nr:Dextranase [Gammaproteobacteria bacterium]
MHRLTSTLAVVVLDCALSEGAELQTWGHANAELNDSTAVAAGNVRRSTIYAVRVATRAAPQVFHDSFTYMSLPRSGRTKEGYSSNDGAEFAAQAKMTMSWTSFLYNADTWVHVEIKEGPALSSADEVTIRPSTLNFQKELVNQKTIRILVPYSSGGYRFSVEFKGEQLTSYKDGSGGLTTSASGNPAVHTEPRNAMMIFAEAMPTGGDADRLVPATASHSIYYPRPGKVSNLQQVTQQVIYFRPGTYYMDWNYHANLLPQVRWVYLAPGAYVKGAFQFRSGPTDLKVTGFGVLSGEQYVYEPDRANHYRHRAASAPDCHGTCVKMLEFAAGPEPQHLTLDGITVANPPYNSFVAYGDVQRFTADVSRYKQVGGWYWQTDGVELYQGSSIKHAFVHSNDDVLKLYASHLTVEGVVVWKADNGPVVQWGWEPRNITDVRVNGLDVIHNRMYSDSHNSCIINSARHYLDPSSSTLADPAKHVTNLFLENIRSEGKNLCAMRLYALSSWDNIHIRNLWIQEWNELDVRTQANKFEALSNDKGERVVIGNEVRDRRGLSIENYVVGGERIRKSGENWRADRPGRLDFDPSLWDNWDAR